MVAVQVPPNNPRWLCSAQVTNEMPPWPIATSSQATGVSGSQLPAEFRGGLDAYFGALEACASRQLIHRSHSRGHGYMTRTRWMICCFVALGVLVDSPLRARVDVARSSSNSSLVTTDHDHQPQPRHHQQVFETSRAHFKRHLAVRIADLKRVCDLDDKQAKKLEVAGKGGVEEAMEQFLQRFPQLNGRASGFHLHRHRGAGPASPNRFSDAVAELRVAVDAQATVGFG